MPCNDNLIDGETGRDCSAPENTPPTPDRNSIDELTTGILGLLKSLY